MDVITGMRTFATVVDTGSFTAAAERLGISTALTSKYVKILEERLGVRLMNRTTRRINVTENGQAYYLRCKALLEDFDELEATIRDQHKVPQGRLLIAAPTTFGEMHLTHAISDYAMQQPNVSIELVLADRFVNIIDEGFDVAVRIGMLTDSSLIARRLSSTRVLTIASPSYLKQMGIPLLPNDLESHQCIIDTNMESRNSWTFHKGDKAYNIKIKGQFSVNNALSVREMVLSSQGVGLCPNYVVGDYLRDGSIKELLKGYDTYEYGIYAVYPHNRHLSMTTRSFVDFLVERYGQLTAW